VTQQAETLALRLVNLSGLPHTPPVDVEGMTELLDIRVSDQESLIEDGRLEVSVTGIYIHLRSDLPKTRRRFTVAHELGHLILPCPRTMTAKRTHWDHSHEERLCDQIAAALLMPHVWTKRHYRERVHNLSTLRHLSHQANVSMGAAIVRLKELLGWRESLLRWRFENSKWRLVAGAGVPPSTHGEIRTIDATSERLTGLGSTRHDKRINLPLLVRSDVVHVPAQVSVIGRSAIALACLPRR
jgi:hypothetical protein